MADSFAFRPVPANFAARFPDGDYTVGRGADPRGRLTASVTGTDAADAPAREKKSRKRIVKQTRPAAE